jgi:D-arabinose 1-dehydrogenase-like Zn-dependent alcohol dehydrogenase
VTLDEAAAGHSAIIPDHVTAFVRGDDVLLRQAVPLRITCNDCGYGETLSCDEAVELGGDPNATVGAFATTLYCPDCRAQGGRGRNLRAEARTMRARMVA